MKSLKCFFFTARAPQIDKLDYKYANYGLWQIEADISMVLWLYKTNKQNCRALPALFVNDIFPVSSDFAYSGFQSRCSGSLDIFCTSLKLG
jgi:hypothetical protein